MKNKLKQLIPLGFKRYLLWFKQVTVEAYKKKKIADTSISRNNRLVASIQSKQKIKVLFLAIHRSVWKVDSIFAKMLSDSYFEPVILVCPYMNYGKDEMISTMQDAYEYFDGKGYSVYKSLKEDGSWVEVEELAPDVVFFTNPHELTKEEYYQNVFQRYLSVYVPYYFMATNHAENHTQQLNSDMKLSMWKIFWPHKVIFNESTRFSVNKGINGSVTGYPAVESLLTSHARTGSAAYSAWKSQDKCKKKIIFSPHHTIEMQDNSLSSFLCVADFFVTIAKKYRNEIQWSFKPHPVLKSKLYQHPDWGKKRTEEYYEFWQTQLYSQLDEGEYEELFSQSDAIIHDCSSFIVEYAFTGKPGLYLKNKNELGGLLNEFGEGVIGTYELSSSEGDIESFVQRIINDQPVNGDYKYFNEYLKEYYSDILPSDRILESIKRELRT